jgi:multiple sugar transport system ATP-binding protein
MPFSTEVEIEIVEPMGSDTLAWTKIAGHPVTFRADSDVVLTVGQKLLVGFDPARGSLFNAETTNRV